MYVILNITLQSLCVWFKLLYQCKDSPLSKLLFAFYVRDETKTRKVSVQIK